MKEVLLCNHTGSFNRGCDAIVKSTADLFSKYMFKTILAEHHRIEDRSFGIDEFYDVVDYSEFNTAPFSRCMSLLSGKIFKQEYISAYFRQKKIWNRLESCIGLNVGGDTYCYTRADRLPSMMLNNFCFKKEIPLIFWGCSIENETIVNTETFNDLQKYTYICPRESITRDNLIKAGISSEKILYMADPAFTLIPSAVNLPAFFYINNTVGINLSPLVLEKSISSDLLIDNYCNMINWILSETNMNVALIPHVYRENNFSFGDLAALKEIYDRCPQKNRVIMFSGFYNSKELKYIISKCRFIVTARTHVSIAAYSSLVPTLVIGYSVKAKGIAIDLFGTEKNYVKSVHDIKMTNDMTFSFKWLYENENFVKERLMVNVPKCIERIEKTVQTITNKYGRDIHGKNN